jgi:hypothetical protein
MSQIVIFGGVHLNRIGDNVKRLRKLHNFNQFEFAQLIGVSQGSLSEIDIHQIRGRSMCRVY